MGIVGKFPPAYMGAIIQGQALGGIIAVMVNIIMLATGLDDVGAAFCDFLIATVYLVGSLGALLYVFSTDFYKVTFLADSKTAQFQLCAIEVLEWLAGLPYDRR